MARMTPEQIRGLKAGDPQLDELAGSTPESVAEKMGETRAYLLKLWGRERYDRTMKPIVAALRTIGAGTDRDPFQVAIDEAKRAGSEGKGGIVWQMTAAACEIAEGRSK